MSPNVLAWVTQVDISQCMISYFLYVEKNKASINIKKYDYRSTGLKKIKIKKLSIDDKRMHYT